MLSPELAANAIGSVKIVHGSQRPSARSTQVLSVLHARARTLACVPHSITRVHAATSLPGYQWEGIGRVSRNMKNIWIWIDYTGYLMAKMTIFRPPNKNEF